MNNLLEKIRQKSHHRRHGSSASQSSAGGGIGDDSSSNQGLDLSEPRSWLPESLSFRTAPLVLRDDLSPGAVAWPGRTVASDSSMVQPNRTLSFHRDLGESVSHPGELLRRCAQRKSRFSNTLMDVLHDPSALAYFLTFMESRGYKHLVKFWLETETFRVTAARLTSKDAEAKMEHKNGNLAMNGFDKTSSSEQCSPKVPASKNLRQMTEQDAVAIFAKYLSKEAAPDQNVGATDELRNSVINRICDVDGRLDPECFAPAQQFVLHILEKRFFADYLKSVAHCKYVLELLNSGRIFITDILYNDVALFHFTEFMEQDGQRNLIEFWLSADSFQQQLSSCSDVEQIQRDAMVLYDRYFSMQATSPLGFNDELRMEIENNICREDGLAPSADCFEKPFRCVLNFMEQEYLPRFLQSSWYARYLSELFNAAQCYDLDLPNWNRPRHKGSTTASTLSSGDGSTGSDRPRRLNTLLAQESPSVCARRRQVEALAESDGGGMAIETSSYDPNTLWKRDRSKIGFARVDPVGRYVREYSQASHRRTMSGGERISEAVRKLVHKDNKEKEALAEEVAALIIRDVTNMTCGAYGDGGDSAAGSQDEFS